MSYVYYKDTMHIVGMGIEDRDDYTENEEYIGLVNEHKVIIFRTKNKDKELFINIDEFLEHCRDDCFKNAALLLKKYEQTNPIYLKKPSYVT